MYKSVLVALVFIFPFFASAHVTVKPAEVGVGAYQTFNVSVPTEKDIATVGIRLVIPEGLESVRPNVKPGWNVEIVKEGEGEEAIITELIWTGGTVPADQRDDFFFSAKSPATEGSLRWNAYQTYSDGSVVAWDTDESEQPTDANGEEDFSAKGPYSQTVVINDLQKEVSNEIAVAMMDQDRNDYKSMKQERGGGLNDRWTLLALIMAGAALALGIRSTLPQKQEDRSGM